MDLENIPLLNAILIGLLGVIILIYLWIRRTYSYWERKGVPHLKAESYVFGNMKDIIYKKKDFSVKYEEIYRKFINEPFCGYYEFHYPALMIKDPDMLQAVLVERYSSFQCAKMSCNKKADELIYYNPFLLNGTRWKETRATISSGLTQNRVRMLDEIIQYSAQEMYDYIDKNTDDIEAYNLSARFASESLANFGWGIRSNGFSDNSTIKKMFDLIAMTSSMQFTLMLLNPLLSWLFNLKLFTNELNSFIKNITNQAIENSENTSKTQNTLLQAILQTREKFRAIGRDISLTEISSNMSTFYLDGYETTSRATSCILYMLMLHPDKQARLKKEIKGLENITIEEVNKLEYLEMFISEVLRLFPIVTVLSRICSEDCKLANVEIKAGTHIAIPVNSIHHNADYYPDPSEFNPENFSEENKKNRHKYTYFPFGAGPRICLGFRYAMANLKLFVCYILKRYDVVPPKNHTANPIVPDVESPFLLIPKYLLYVSFKKTNS